MGFQLFQKGELSIPDRFHYFLDGFWNFENFEIFWTRSGPLNPVFVMNLFGKIQEKIKEHP